MAGRKGHGPHCGKTGPLHPTWKGDDATRDSKRYRARVAYPLAGILCERCGKVPATDRHHKDGDTGNNGTDNIERLCRRCHGEVDPKITMTWYAGWATPRRCGNCGDQTRHLRRGRCPTCLRYWKTHGEERPIQRITPTEKRSA